MKIFLPVHRTTLHIPDTGPDHDKERGHLHIVINDPCQNKKNLLVSLQSWHKRCDKTCVLSAGHKFVKHKSFISYAHSIIADTDDIVSEVQSERVSYEGLFREEEFALIYAGVMKSTLTEPVVREYFRHFCC